MSPILQALGSGYSEEEVLKYISKAIPKLVPSINKAIDSGYGIKNILGFLSKSSSKIDTRGLSESEVHARANERKNEFVRSSLGAAATVVAAPLVMNGAKSALSRALPAALTHPSGPQATANSNAGNLAPLPQQPLQSQTATPPIKQQSPNPLQPVSSNISSQPPLSNANAASIPEPTNIQQPKQNSNIVDKLWTSFEKGRDKGFDFESDAFLKIAKRMKSTGEINSKEDFQRFFDLFDAKKNEGKDLPTALKEASGEFDNQRLGNTKELQLQEEQGLPEETKQPEAKIEKNSTVIAPNGVGEVKEIRNGKAIVEIDGKRHQVDEDELESSPIPEKDLADLYDELIKGIERETEEDVSRMVQWAGYNPDTNTLQFLPHTGDLYTYDDISEEDAALLEEILSVRKTSGSNFIGAWKKDSKSPIGAALSKLIRKLQSERGGKGQEYSAKHGTIYSAYEPAIQAKKEEEKEMKKKDDLGKILLLLRDKAKKKSKKKTS